MADDKTQKSMTTLGISMRRFGRNLMRHYERPMSEPQHFDRQVKPYQTMATSPLNWDNIVTPKQNNREAPLPDEAFQDANPEQIMPRPAPRQARPPQRPIQRQPAPPKKKGLDPRLEAILNFHNQRDAQREIQRKERRAKWEEAHEQGDSQQASPDIPGWKAKPRASFDYIETSALIKDKAEKPDPKQEAIQRDEDENPPKSRSKVIEAQDFSQPEMEEGYIAANEPSWDDVDDEFEESRRITPIDSPYSGFNNDFQETERITPLDEPFNNVDTTKNIRMPSSKHTDTASTTSTDSSLQRQVDDIYEDYSDVQATDSPATQYPTEQADSITSSYEQPTKSSDAPQGYFERRQPRPKRLPRKTQQDRPVQRKPQATETQSHQDKTGDSQADTHDSDEDLSELSPDLARYEIQRQTDEMWDDAEAVDPVSDSIDAPYAMQRLADDDWDDDFDTHIIDTSDFPASDMALQPEAMNESYPQLDKTPDDNTSPIQRQADKQETTSKSDNTQESIRPIQRHAESTWQEDESYLDGQQQATEPANIQHDTMPQPIQRQSEDSTPQYSDIQPVNNASDPIQRHPDIDSSQQADITSDEHDFSAPAETTNNFSASVQGQSEDNWGDNLDTQIIDTSDYATNNAVSQVQRQADDSFTHAENRLDIDSSNDNSHPIQRQIDNQHQPRNDAFTDNTSQRQNDNAWQEHKQSEPSQPFIKPEANALLQRQVNYDYSEDDITRNYPQADSPDTASQPIQRAVDNDIWGDDEQTQIIDSLDDTRTNTVQHQANFDYQDNSESNNDSQGVETSNGEMPQRPLQHRHNSETKSQTNHPKGRIQREADTPDRYNEADANNIVDEVQDEFFPKLDHTEANTPIVQRSMGVDGQMVYDVIEADDTPVARQTDPTNNLHQALIEAGIVPADSPSPETFEQASSQFDDSAPKNQANTQQSTLQRTPDEHSPSTQSNQGKPTTPRNTKSSEIVQRQMGADGEMYYNKAQEDDALPEHSMDVFQGLMQAGMISPQDNPVFNTDFASTENTAIQRSEDEAQSDIGISQNIQNAMLQRLRDKNNDIIQQKAQARHTQDTIQRAPEPIQPTYTTSVQRTPPIDMLMREEFISDDDSVDDVEKLTRDVYRLLSNRLRDEAERRNRK